MNETSEPNTIEPAQVVLSCDEGEGSPFSCAKLRMWLFALVFVLALVAGYFMNKAYPDLLGLQTMESGAPVLSADLVAKLELIDKRLQQMEEKEKAALETAKSDGTISSSQMVPDAQDLAKLKDGLATLSGALSMIKSEIQKTMQATDSERTNMQAGMASIIAYMQMQKAALSGGPFEAERQVMRKTVGQDEKLIDALVKLEPLALTGVASMSTLQKEWRKLSGAAQTALRQSGAQTWFDRLVVALEGLVSIKSLKEPAGHSLSMESIDLDLEQGKLSVALEKAAAMPSTVQDVIKAWMIKAQMRLELDRLLESVTARLIERGMVVEPESAEVKP